MERWVRLCDLAEAPKAGDVVEIEAPGKTICLANVGGELHAIDNVCPHRQGPLGQGWVEGHAVVCPWHAWAFDVTTGQAEEPEQGQVAVYRLRADGNDLLVDLP